MRDKQMSSVACVARVIQCYAAWNEGGSKALCMPAYCKMLRWLECGASSTRLHKSLEACRNCARALRSIIRCFWPQECATQKRSYALLMSGKMHVKALCPTQLLLFCGEASTRQHHRLGGVECMCTSHRRQQPYS